MPPNYEPLNSVSGSLGGDLTQKERLVSLRVLWIMMTAWGARTERQERYRAFWKPRWPLSGAEVEE